MGLSISSGRHSSTLEPEWRLAFAIRDAADASSFLLVRSNSSAPQPGDEFSDSDIWELPCFNLAGLEKQKKLDESDELCSSIEAALQETGVKNLAVEDIVSKVQELVTSPLKFSSVLKLIAEPDFGPKRAFRTVVVALETMSSASSSGSSDWFDAKHAMQLLVNEAPHEERIGVLAANLFYESFSEGLCCDIKFEEEHQEYPPGILVMPMASRTLRPFSKTNLVLCAPTSFSEAGSGSGDDATFTADALIVDPGCSVPSQNQLAAIVESLPRKLIVFVTHHHLDHTEGLPAIARTNPEAIVLAHENTFQRMGSVGNGLQCVPVTGGTKVVIRGRRFEIIDAPGHTDGHLCLFNVDTRTLVAGDHCVGEGSSILDGNSGGNLHDYLTTSHRLLELAPKVVVPMHGRPNLWPSQLLKGYIKHRKTREASVLKAIESGAASAFDIVSNVYKQTPLTLWPAALMNVKSHVEHLESQRKLPAEFSVENFKSSCGYRFMLRLFGRVIVSRAPPTGYSLLVLAAAVGIIYVVKY